MPKMEGRGKREKEKRVFNRFIFTEGVKSDSVNDI